MGGRHRETILEAHFPHRLTPNTTDPRLARLQYNEPDLMDTDDDSKPAATPENEWTLVTGSKAATPSPDAAETPLPTSPPRSTPIKGIFKTPQVGRPPSPGNTSTPRPPPPVIRTDASTYASATTANHAQDDNRYVRINDGTLRITAKWRPTNFDELAHNQELWNLAATDLINYMFQHAMDVTVHSWIAEATPRIIAILELNPNNLLSFLCPKITTLPSMKMFILTIRVCLIRGPGRWINTPVTKQAFLDHHVEVNVSNSSSDSGDTIATAGYIFFKYPRWTHRHHYLTHLRRQFQESTPFFDLGFHRKTPTGQNIPHLAIRCGENHVSALTDILSAHLDGSKTAVFLGRLFIAKMSPPEVDALFDTQAEFTTNLRTLSLAPLVQNIDRLRIEHYPTYTIERSTREWVKSLVDSKGKSIKCDVENGGDNRAVQILVPLEQLQVMRDAVRAYKERISPFAHRETNFTERVNQVHPTEIYVPTPTAQNNLSLLKSLSSSSVWVNAPASIRSPASATTRCISTNDDDDRDCLPMQGLVSSVASSMEALDLQQVKLLFIQDCDLTDLAPKWRRLSSERDSNEDVIRSQTVIQNRRQIDSNSR